MQSYIHPGNFSFGEINSGDYSYAIFTIGTNLESVRNYVGGIGLPVNSGYRNPVHNLALNAPGAPNSRHIYGDAADIAVVDIDGDGVVENGPTGEDTIALRDAALAQGASFTQVYNTHVHMDWR